MKYIFSSFIAFTLLLLSFFAPMEVLADYEDSNNYRTGIPACNYITGNPDGTKTICTAKYDRITGIRHVEVSVYDSDLVLLSTKRLECELQKFGAIFFGKNYNYAAFGDSNFEENDQKEVIRIVKYDKQFNRLASASVYGGEFNITDPFYGGTPRFAEYENTLILYAARVRYKSEDGKNHQSNLRVVLNTSTMRVSKFSEYPFVSHSFNQFVLFDDGQPVFLDHGDGYPRAVVLNKIGEYQKDEYKVNRTLYEMNSNLVCYEVIMHSMPGPDGLNTTGVCVGGFEISDTSYIAVINTLEFTDWSIRDFLGDDRIRDIVICVLPRDSISDLDVKKITVGKYVGTDIMVSIPHLVKISGDRFAVLWQENPYSKRPGDTVCVIVNDKGEVVSTAKRFPNIQLSNCKPVQDSEGNLIWFDDHDNEFDLYMDSYSCFISKNPRIFYRINLSTGSSVSYIDPAKPSSTAVIINGKTVFFETYNIKGNNYFSLRDLAYILNGTNKQFSIDWDRATGETRLMLGEAYTPIGGEMERKGTESKIPVYVYKYLYVNDRQVSPKLNTYNIDGNNYFRLSEIGNELGFEAVWDYIKNAYIVDTDKDHVRVESIWPYR